MKWLSIIGIPDEGIENLSKAARKQFDAATVLVSSHRIFNLLENDSRERIVWENDFSLTLNQIIELKPEKVCILATGDPMFFGIGSTLVRHVDAGESEIIPSPSIFSLIRAKMMWAHTDCNAVSLHGRKLNSLIRFLGPGVKLVLLSHDGQTPQKVAKLLCSCGYASSQMTIFEHLGGQHEKISTTRASDFSLSDIADFNSIALNCNSHQPSVPTNRAAGIDDAFFNSDGVMTKKHIRALTLSSLAPGPKDLLWDIGAGAGTVAIEWLRSVEGTRAYAVEQNPKRIEYIQANTQALGTPELNIIDSTASSQTLKQLPDPDAVFIGGGSSDFELIDYCWQKLKPGGRLVINTVSINAEQNLMKALNSFGGNITRISLEHLQSLGSHQAWKPERAISHYYVTKGQSS